MIDQYLEHELSNGVADEVIAYLINWNVMTYEEIESTPQIHNDIWDAAQIVAEVSGIDNTENPFENFHLYASEVALAVLSIIETRG